MIDRYEWRTEYKENHKSHYKFAKEGKTVNLENGETANVVIPGFINNHARFDYHEDDQLYYRSEFGSAQIDQANGQQLAFKNIIIQECPSAMFDDRYLWTDPSNGAEGGEGWFITNGKAEKITWRKSKWDEADNRQANIVSVNLDLNIRGCDFHKTRYFDMDGKEIILNPGKTFVEIVRNQDVSKIVISDDSSIDSHIIDSL